MEKVKIARQLEEDIRLFEERRMEKASGMPCMLASLRRQKAVIPYGVVAPYMTRENLQLLSQQKISRRLLVNLSSTKMVREDLFLFWEDILSAVDILPVEWRARIFLDCLLRSRSCTPHERCGRTPYYNFNNYDKDEMAGYVVSSKWLVDIPLVRKWYCRLHKPGAELLRCIDQRREVNYPMRCELMEFIRGDDLPGFGLMYTMTGQGANWTLVMDVLKNNATRIFDWLLENAPDMFAAINPYYLMVYAVSNLSMKMALHTVDALERCFPGTVAQRDEFGNNLLWYCLGNKRIDWYDTTCAMVDFLCRKGCESGLKNHLGLSFDDIRNALTSVIKRNFETYYTYLTAMEN